jgi:tRNA threonylcarbamoyl adenosine modification protein (Sua5/YciO/YrdC/YwlC family)
VQTAEVVGQNTSVVDVVLKDHKKMILSVDYQTPDPRVLKKTVEILKDGGLIIYPTDTVYGIGCLLKEESVRRISYIKNRDYGKPFSIACSNQKMIRHYTRVRQDLSGGPVTYIVEKTENVPDFVTCGLGTVGIRVFEKGLVYEVVEACERPIVTTSANLAGAPAPKTVSEIEDVVIEGVDLVLDAGECVCGKPSTIIDLTQKGKILRK